MTHWILHPLILLVFLAGCIADAPAYPAESAPALTYRFDNGLTLTFSAVEAAIPVPERSHAPAHVMRVAHSGHDQHALWRDVRWTADDAGNLTHWSVGCIGSPPCTTLQGWPLQEMPAPLGIGINAWLGQADRASFTSVDAKTVLEASRVNRTITISGDPWGDMLWLGHVEGYRLTYADAPWPSRVTLLPSGATAYAAGSLPSVEPTMRFHQDPERPAARWFANESTTIYRDEITIQAVLDAIEEAFPGYRERLESCPFNLGVVARSSGHHAGTIPVEIEQLVAFTGDGQRLDLVWSKEADVLPTWQVSEQRAADRECSAPTGSGLSLAELLALQAGLDWPPGHTLTFNGGEIQPSCDRCGTPETRFMLLATPDGPVANPTQLRISGATGEAFAFHGPADLFDSIWTT